VELATALGARVIAAASSDEKLALAREHGAADGFNYTTMPLRDELKRRGSVDVVVDPVGGEFSELAVRGLRPGGRLLIVGFAAGEIPRIALNLPLLKDCSLVGVFLAAQTRDDPARFVANLRTMFDLYLRGQLRPQMVEIDALSDHSLALEHLNDRQACGKVLMRFAAEHGAVARTSQEEMRIGAQEVSAEPA
jgi:NADPH:quinone reductase-like Zn-dependent oxidoreductase